MSTQLQQEFNQHLSVIQLLHVLNYTLNPLLTIQSLRSIPLLGVINSVSSLNKRAKEIILEMSPFPPVSFQRPQIPVLSFCVIPQSSSHVRLIYRNK